MTMKSFVSQANRIVDKKHIIDDNPFQGRVNMMDNRVHQHISYSSTRISLLSLLKAIILVQSFMCRK